MNMNAEIAGRHPYVTYFFISLERNYGFPSVIAREKFTDLYKDDLGWTHKAFSTFSGQELKSFISPQFEAMSSTVGILEAAIHDESLGNQETLSRYEQIAEEQAA